MPTTEQILAGLKEVANSWQTLAIFWHVYFAAIAVGLILGLRPSRRMAGILLGLPLVSVSVVAWASGNPFNGIIYALAGVLVIVMSLKLAREEVRIAPGWAMIPGAFLFAFGWIYPHFLGTTSFLPYLYSAPTGLIPCPTLSIVIGLTLILNGLNSRTLPLILGFAGLFYGITGVAQLGVMLDWGLLAGAVLLVVFTFVRKR